MQVDIKIHVKGFLSEAQIYRNIREHMVSYIDNVVNIQFYYTPKKGKERFYHFQIPKENLISIAIRRTE